MVAVARPPVPDEERINDFPRVQDAACVIIAYRFFAACLSGCDRGQKIPGRGCADELPLIFSAGRWDGKISPAVPKQGKGPRHRKAVLPPSNAVPFPLQGKSLGERQFRTFFHGPNRVHIVKREIAQIAFQRKNEIPHQAAGDGRRILLERGRVKECFSRFPDEDPPGGGSGGLFQEFILVPADGS